MVKLNRYVMEIYVMCVVDPGPYSHDTYRVPIRHGASYKATAFNDAGFGFSGLASWNYLPRSAHGRSRQCDSAFSLRYSPDHLKPR